MPNALAKDLEIMFEEYIEGYDAACVISREADTSYPSPVDMQRAGDTFYKMQNYHASVVTGLDVSGATKTDLIQRMVPTVFRSPDNVVYQLDAKEMRDPEHLRRMGQAASNRLAAEIDKNLYSTVSAQASIFVKKVGAFSWDDAATAEALMLSRGIGSGRERKMFLNPFDYKDVAKDLGNRAYMGDVSKSAYERSQVPDIAGFKTFRTDNVANIAGVGTVSGITVSGATSHTVTAMTGDVPTDNRRMAMTVAGANLGNIKNGDRFTLANSGTPINAVHQIDKSDTGQPLTFTVISGAGTANLVVSPAIIATGPYQNATAAASNGATLTFLNTASKPANVFWAQGAVSLDYGRLAFPTGQGADVKTASTSNGVPLIMSYQFNHLTGITTVRFTTLYATTVLDPEQCGVILANQS
jgi:P22 coat protein - gene protein 5